MCETRNQLMAVFTLDDKLTVQPQMVDTWEVSQDRLRYTFTLRNGRRWHDGQPVTSADVLASLKRWGQRDSQGKLLMRVTDSLQEVNDKTLQLFLKEPFELVLEALAKPSSNVPFILAARVVATPPDEQIKETIGSGPFIFVKEEWQPGHRVVYVRNPDYVPRPEPASSAAGGKRVYLDRVEWLYIPAPATASAALEAGEVDYWERVPLDFVARLEPNPSLAVAVVDPLGSQGKSAPIICTPHFTTKKRARPCCRWSSRRPTYGPALATPSFGDPVAPFSCVAVPGKRMSPLIP